MQDELIRIQQELNKTIVFITHDLAEAVRLGDRIAIMRDGAVVQIGEPEDIVLRPEDDYVAEFTRDVRRESILTARHVMVDAPLRDPRRRAAQAGARHHGGHRSRRGDAADRRPHLYRSADRRAGAGRLRDGRRGTSRPGPQAVAQARRIPVAPDITLEELIPISMASDHLVPVVDRAGRLRGVVDRNTLAETISVGD